MASFDLYREAMRQYELIVPDQVDGLVLVALFEQFDPGSFKEEQINLVIDKVYRDLGKSSQRNEYDRNNSILIRLQEFYLSRDEHKKTYQFKTFGRKFCENLRERLIRSYNPAKIKRLFDGLLLDLERYLKTEGNGYNMWYADQFTRICPEITAHVEILDQQVSQSVREFKKKIKDGPTDIHALLDEIILRLDGIKQQAKELREAFSATYDIDYILEDILVKGLDGADSIFIEHVFEFNNSIRGQLEQISLRIDHIKPRIREFIYEFNQRDFDRKSALFLDFIIKNSCASKNQDGKEYLSLPDGIGAFLNADLESLPRFVIVPDKDISPKPPVEVYRREIDAARQDQVMEQNKARVHEKQRISFWISEVKKRLSLEEMIDYSGMFLEIFEEENFRLSVPLKVTNKIIRDFARQKIYEIKIDQQFYKHNKNAQIRLWKMNILKI